MSDDLDLASYGPKQGSQLLGIKQWQFLRASERGVIPAPDVAGKRWSAAVLRPFLSEEARARIIAEVGEHPGVGAVRAAEELASGTGLHVDRADVSTLASRGLLRVVGHYKENPLFALDEIRSFAALGELEAIITERLAADG